MILTYSSKYSLLVVSLALLVSLLATVTNGEVRNSLNLGLDSSNRIDIDSADVVNNDYVDESDDNVNSLDLDEVSPRENNCVFTEKLAAASNQTTLTCSKIPLFCRQVCDSLHKLAFNEKLKKISPFSFGSYKIKSYMQLNFNAALRRIDSDAFNGMIIESDQTLRVNIGLTDQEVAVFAVDSDEYEDELNAISSKNSKRSPDENSLNQAGDNDNDDNDDEDKAADQIEYDIQTPSTRPDDELLRDKNMKSSEPVLTTRNLIIAPNSFRGVLIKPGGRLVINIKNYHRVTFDESSLKSLQMEPTSSFFINVENGKTVLFKSRCARQWTANQMTALPGEPATPSDTVTFRVNVTAVDSVYFEKESFADMVIDKASTFQVLVSRFSGVVALGSRAFANMMQKERANFELSVSHGKRLQTSEDLFTTLRQSTNSKVMININSIASDLCLLKNTFANVFQAFNSTVRLAISIAKRSSVVLASEAFASIKQAPRSLFQVYLVNGHQVAVDKWAVTELVQAKGSVFEVWSSKASSSLVLRKGAFKSVRQAEASAIKLSFVSGPNTLGGYYQASMVFEDFASAVNAEVVFDFSQSKNLL
jgi:hypothetical protein